MTSPERIVVVGASLAGLTAASTLRSRGFAGELVIVDASPSMPADRPPLSKQVLAGTMEPEAAVAALASRIDGVDADVRFGHRVVGAQFTESGHRLTFADGSELNADGAVIATGSVARWPADLVAPDPADPGRVRPRLTGVHVIRDLSDSLALKADLAGGPRRLVVIGAGFIGAEVAATARTAGHDVTIVEYEREPLARVMGGPVGPFIARLHRNAGVELHLGVGLDEVLGEDGRTTGVRLTDGRTLDADVVVLGLGAAPDLAWASDSGLTIDNGIVCDETLSAGPGVVAAGDVANWPNRLFGERMRVEHWENAIEQGEAAANRLLVEQPEDAVAFDSIPWFWSDQYDTKLQMAGRPSGTDDVVVVEGDPDGDRFVLAFRRGDRCVAVLGANRPRAAVIARMRMRESLDWHHVVDGLV